MLKKAVHIVLASLLLVSTVGMAVSKHYCRGDLVSVSFFHEAHSCCSMAGCCQNENHFYKVKDDFSSPAVLAVPLLAEIDILGQQFFQIETLLPENNKNTQLSYSDSPPPLTVREVLAREQLYLL
ncbi:hypothetical protein GM418_12825 [Maribellus comscasis]|uniref:Secreted protein n=1 Tax=Maribellus comscasis TaxID=2681766 RepID=A0A6I6JPY4_9BACT|nr:hypothetical protein [Maribellus comscasis]QGY44511.1 hypothetical protein GM418_12825 [Maribellus comscasis]